MERRVRGGYGKGEMRVRGGCEKGKGMMEEDEWVSKR